MRVNIDVPSPKVCTSMCNIVDFLLSYFIFSLKTSRCSFLETCLIFLFCLQNILYKFQAIELVYLSSKLYNRSRDFETPEWKHVVLHFGQWHEFFHWGPGSNGSLDFHFSKCAILCYMTLYATDWNLALDCASEVQNSLIKISEHHRQLRISQEALSGSTALQVPLLVSFQLFTWRFSFLKKYFFLA